MHFQPRHYGTLGCCIPKANSYAEKWGQGGVWLTFRVKLDATTLRPWTLSVRFQHQRTQLDFVDIVGNGMQDSNRATRIADRLLHVVELGNNDLLNTWPATSRILIWLEKDDERTENPACYHGNNLAFAGTHLALCRDASSLRCAVC